MFRDDTVGAASTSQSTPSHEQPEEPMGLAPEKGKSKYETVLYRNVHNVLPSQDAITAINNDAASAPSASEGSSGAIMTLDGIREAYNRVMNPAMYYGTQQTYSSLPSQSSVSTETVEQMPMGATQNITGMAQIDIDSINDINEVYDVVPNRLDRSVTVSELIKLNEAITELTKRMPMPPTPELLNAIEPHLSMTLQLTYLRAYIQNQQLLIDVRNRLFGSMLNSCDFKSTMRQSVPTLCAPTSMETRTYTEPFYRSSEGDNSMAVDVTDTTWTRNPAIEYSLPNGERCAPALYESCNKNDMYANGAMMPYMPFVGVADAADDFKQAGSLDPMALANECYKPMPALLSLTSADTAQHNGSGSEPNSPRGAPISPREQQLTGTTHSEDKDGGNTGMTPIKSVVPLIPPEIKNMVKYDAQKHSFVSVYLGPLGARRRRLFSIRKFGMEMALKLATDFAVGSTSAAVPSKERRLLEEVCTVALRCNPKSGTKIEYVEEARSMPETRGLVFSCGAQLWMIITYDSSSGERDIETFAVESLGFEGAYKAAVAALDRRLQDGEIMTSKLSGPLYFWLESEGKVLCLMVTSRDLMRQSTSDQKIYIGRFDVTSSGGFNGARKLAQKWRSDLRSELLH
ncbi:transcription factor with AP2 domain(s), putative [Babesia ovis]|uniref:Transcription factor with AP2 domain(S), putative n=1 Tax=Babesia ovis TaxID=5869 RepID=A0A9W5TDI7_BABOV|nr:transcription factor with AP2 domain(s), putative [Babesia ovis]